MLTLDAMRGGAALAVVTYHALGVASQTAQSGWQAWLPQITGYIVHYAFAGIYLFFVISGFCIHLFWAKARAAGVQEPTINFFTFWKRRVRRLYPPYFAALALYLCYIAYKTPVHVTSFYLWDVLLHVFMLHNLDLRTTYTINGAFWTLAIEEQLYLAYFLLLFLRIRFGWTKTLADNFLRARRLANHRPRVERIAWHPHSGDGSGCDQLVHLGARRFERRGSFRINKTSTVVLQNFNGGGGPGLRNGARSVSAPCRSV